MCSAIASVPVLDRFSHNPTAYDDDWEGQPTQSRFHQWIAGLAVPLTIACFGVDAIVFGAVTVGGSKPLALHGTNAIAFGIAAMGAAIFLHCHYFWGNVFDQAWLAVLGKMAGAIAFILATGLLVVRGFLFGLK